jgi:acetyltransferase-like isoleucine patch superfamily enzyme
MLSEQQCKLIEKGLTEDVEPRKVAAYLCLHMGLMLAEAAALRRQDIDLDAGTVAVCHVLGRPEGGDASCTEFMPIDAPRVIPMPPHVKRYLSENSGFYPNDDCFILTAGTEIPALHSMQNGLTSLCAKYKVADGLSATDLRNAFIRRCIQSGIDLYSLCQYIGIKQPNVILKHFGGYFVPHLESVQELEKYGAGYISPEPMQKPEIVGPKRMNLLILGAGSQGPVVKEIAEALGVFHDIAYLDDDPDNRLAMDTCANYERYMDRYPIAIPSFGDSFLREKWVDKLERAGYILPTLIHPSATVSPSAEIGMAVVVEARSIISAGASVGEGVIASSGSVIEAMAKVGEFAHVGAAATVTKNAVIPAYKRISSGAVVRDN